jgi:crotonobetainyl-CoA:carnitine CoA-transferase CaiB-like acyl-CoA transferase
MAPGSRPPHTTEVACDPAVAAVDLLEEHRFPSGQPYLIPSRYARFSRTEQAPLADAPGIGEHSREVLVEAGLSPAEVDALVQEKVVVEGLPFVLQALVNYR